MRYLIAHAPWAPGRKESLARLLKQLPAAEVVASRGPEHASIWARRVWERALENDRSCCILNDDVVLVHDFFARVEAATTALPDECISLHCNNPNVLPHAALGVAWVRCYHYSGPGVVLPPGAARALLDFVYRLPWSFLSRVNEDVIAGLWAWSRQRPFWYLLPSPVQHDTSTPSTCGFDAHPNRKALVEGSPRDLAIVDKDAVPFAELDWSLSPGLRYRHLVLRAGRQLCGLCLGREGVVGSASLALCEPCVAQLHELVLRGAT